MSFRIGHRVAVIHGGLEGFYGHVTNHVVHPRTGKILGVVGVTPGVSQRRGAP